jgi:hypothetical protein
MREKKTRFFYVWGGGVCNNCKTIYLLVRLILDTFDKKTVMH